MDEEESDLLVMSKVRFVSIFLFILTLTAGGTEVQDCPYIEIPSSAYGERDGAPLLLSHHQLPYALIFNPDLNQGFVINWDNMKLHPMDDRGAIDVVYGGCRRGDDMEHPYNVGSMDGVRMFRNYFVLQNGRCLVYLNTQGECIQQDEGGEPPSRELAPPQECIASFEQFSPRELYGDMEENYTLHTREENDSQTAYLFDRNKKEVWHRVLPPSCTHVLWDELRTGSGLLYVVGSKIYVPFRDRITCISQGGSEDILYEPGDPEACMNKHYTCKTGPDDCFFIRLTLSESSSFWEIVHVHKDEIRRSRLAVHDTDGVLFQWAKSAAVPEEMTPQIAGSHLILLTEKGQKWVYTWCTASAQQPVQTASADPVFFHYSPYLKVYLAITRGQIEPDGAEYKAAVPARMYLLKTPLSVHAAAPQETHNSAVE